MINYELWAASSLAVTTLLPTSLPVAVDRPGLHTAHPVLAVVEGVHLAVVVALPRRDLMGGSTTTTTSSRAVRHLVARTVHTAKSATNRVTWKVFAGTALVRILSLTHELPP
jgi:hypothetical protein